VRILGLRDDQQCRCPCLERRRDDACGRNDYDIHIRYSQRQQHDRTGHNAETRRPGDRRLAARVGVE
jgi:hypothetical protein